MFTDESAEESDYIKRRRRVAQVSPKPAMKMTEAVVASRPASEPVWGRFSGVDGATTGVTNWFELFEAGADPFAMVEPSGTFRTSPASRSEVVTTCDAEHVTESPAGRIAGIACVQPVSVALASVMRTSSRATLPVLVRTIE